MSVPPSQPQTPPSVASTAAVPLAAEGSGVPPGYAVMLPPSVGQQPPRPIQMVQGLDGVIYAVTAPTVTTAAKDNHSFGSVSPSKSILTSSMPQLSQIGVGTASAVMPQGLNFATPPSAALLAAAAAAQVQAAATATAQGAQVNVGALAAAAALQGQNPSSYQFPFIPIYTPFSMPSSSLLPQPGGAQTLSLQQPVLSGTKLPTLPTTQPVTQGSGAFLLPAHSAQLAEDLLNVKGHKAAPSIQSLLAPNELLSSDKRKRVNQSSSVSSNSDCSPSPTVCKTEPFSSAWSKNSVHVASTSTVSLSKELQHSPRSPLAGSSSCGGPADLIQRGIVLQRVAQGHSQEKGSDEEQTRMDPVPSSGQLQNVKSFSSLSRYVTTSQSAQTQPGATNLAGGSSSLEKLLQAKPETRERETSLASLQGTGPSSDHSTMFNLLQEEPHLLQFYNFFCKSHLSNHLRIRILTTEGGASVLKWIEVTRQASHIDPSFGPVDAARIVISSNGLCKLQLMFPYSKTMSTRFVPTTMAQANDLFSELSPKHVVCPGLPDCESKLNSLGYQPTNIRIVETPIMKRYDHEKCPIWHIPLPCNIYSESGQILHHMCKQCKNLLNTLNKTITKIAGLNVAAGASKNHELPYDITMGVRVSSRSASVSSGLSSPPYLLRPPPTGAGGQSEGTASAKETHGRKRKRRTYPKDEESSGSATVKPTTVLPEIYQLLRDPSTIVASHSTTPAPSQHESITTTSTATATAAADKITLAVSEHTSITVASATAHSSVIVQAKGHERTDPSATAPGTCSGSTAVIQSQGECTAEPELMQTDASREQAGRDKSSSQYESRCSSPTDDGEVESSTLCSNHTEDEGEETDSCSSPSSAENVDVESSVVKKPKIL